MVNGHRLASVADVSSQKYAQARMKIAMYRVIRILTETQVQFGKSNWPTVWPVGLFSESDAWTADKIVEAVKHGLPYQPNPGVQNRLCGLPVPRPITSTGDTL